jgi:hypothetical protein
MGFRLSCVTHNDSSVSIYFENFGHWDNFSWIVGLLEEENECTLLSNDSSEHFRLAKLTHKEIAFDVWHNYMLGNFLFSATGQDVDVLMQLAENVIAGVTQRLGEKGVVLAE